MAGARTDTLWLLVELEAAQGRELSFLDLAVAARGRDVSVLDAVNQAYSFGLVALSPPGGLNGTRVRLTDAGATALERSRRAAEPAPAPADRRL